ncbi:virulence factor [Ciceribacter sp. L1K23]|uniref:virulence factor n=1 Tax=Ciceribacter sp. L1K23 TaxID=2820276 RepID=UPI001B8170AD|nr:virulence factor [Ciceribacter sp. L1K23]MBR0555517.1 virulence factor [Ciceribacter sp. L1K23]
MADRIIVYWRDIPAQVIVRKGRTSAKRELSLRFTEAIDMCAMRSGAAETDEYLAEWRKADPVSVSDDLEAEADKAAAEIEAAYDKERLVKLVHAGGRDAA